MYILLYSMVNRYCFVSCIQYILPLNLLNFLLDAIGVLHSLAEFAVIARRLAGGLYACYNRASRRLPRRENDHVTVIVILIGGRMVMSRRQPV